MSNWPLLSGSNALDDIGTSTATSSVTALTANTTANVKGTTYTQLIAATAQPYVGLFVFVHGNSATAARALIDIAIGAAASEAILIPDVLFWTQAANALRRHCTFYFPIAVPAGVRLSMRAQSSAASWAMRVGLMGVPANPFQPFGFHRCTAYGADTTDSGGTLIDSGATANTKGAYGVLSASTTNAMKVMVPVIAGGTNVTPGAASNVLYDISVGAAAAEQIVISNAPYYRTTNVSTEASWCYPPTGVNIPSATRLTARCQGSGTDTNARQQDMIVYGFD